MLVNFYNLIQRQGGATFRSGRIVEYTSGYQVATRDGVEMKTETLGELLLSLDILELDSVGIWYDNGLWYADTSSVHIGTLEEAQALAKQENQIAIYDWSTGNSLAV